MYRGATLQMDVEDIADGLLARPVGELDLTTAAAFRDEIRQIQLSMPARLVLDLCHVSYMDSSAVSTLVEAMQVARRSDGILVLCGLQERVRGILEISRLDDSVFKIVDTTDEAIAIPNRRKFKRFAPSSIRCDVGDLLDISAGGVKLGTRRRLRGRVSLVLRTASVELSLQADVVWARRIRFRRHEAGLRFAGLTTEDARQLAAIVSDLRDAAGDRR